MTEVEYWQHVVYQQGLALGHTQMFIDTVLVGAMEKEKLLRSHIDELYGRIEEVANWKRGEPKREKGHTRWSVPFAWALDYCRAMRERPKIVRITLRLFMGKHAYREFIGLQDALENESFSPYFEYGCQNVEYHSDPLPFDYGLGRKPLPLKATP